MDDRAGLGRAGEKHAEQFLRRRRGHRVVTRNYQCPAGEIDLVTLDGRTVVFVEVKTRTDRDYADPQDAVNLVKQRRLLRSAAHFLHQTRADDRACRFDIVAITLDADRNLQIEHLEDAFTPEGQAPDAG